MNVIPHRKSNALLLANVVRSSPSEAARGSHPIPSCVASWPLHRRKEASMVIEVTQIDSPYLTGNLIGDPSRRDLIVYLPPGYGASHRHFPVAYLLHGFSRRATRWIAGPLVERGSFRPTIDDVIGEAITKHG